MKKIFTLFAALAMVMSMSAKPYLRGSMNGWGSTEFQNGECTVNLTANTKYEFKVDENNDWKTSYGGAAITSTNCTDVKLSGSSNATIQSTFKGDYKFKWNASNKTITVVYPTEEVVKPKKDITVKAKMPAEWTKTIDAWVWTDENPNGKAVTPERDGDWYVVTQNTAASYIIFRNGASWNGDSNQTADMRFEDNACIQLQYNASAKASYINIDCADDTEDPTPDPEDPVDPNPGDDPVVEPETGVTYNVTVPAGTKACYIAGEMNGWSQQEMTKVDETHYTITIAEATTAMKYKYCSGPDWAYVEMQADGVTDVQDRTYAANDVVEAWKAVYEPAGEEPGETPGDDPDQPENPDTPEQPEVTTISLAGTMNEWDMTANPFVVAEGGQTASLTIALEAATYEFKVVVDNKWLTNTGEMTRDNCTGWLFENLDGMGNNAKIVADVAGDYVFVWSIADSKLSVTYPVAGEEPGDEPVDPETAVDDVTVGVKAVKVIRNGQMYIIRDGVIYNAMGQIAE